MGELLELGIDSERDVGKALHAGVRSGLAAIYGVQHAVVGAHGDHIGPGRVTRGSPKGGVAGPFRAGQDVISEVRCGNEHRVGVDYVAEHRGTVAEVAAVLLLFRAYAEQVVEYLVPSAGDRGCALGAVPPAVAGRTAATGTRASRAAQGLADELERVLLTGREVGPGGGDSGPRGGFVSRDDARRWHGHAGVRAPSLGLHLTGVRV